MKACIACETSKNAGCVGSNSLEELSHIGFLPFDPAALETAIGEISDLTVEV